MDSHESPEYFEYIQKANQARGHVINTTILLERVMDDFIASEFSDSEEKKIQVIETLMQGLNYRTKTKIMGKFLIKYYPDKKTREEKFKGFADTMGKIADERNLFAHDLLYINLTKEQFQKFEICLVSFKNVKDVVCYIGDDIIGITDRVQKYVDIIAEIKTERSRQSPKQ